MSVADALGAAAGVLLVFVLPGFALSKAIFPERRVRGPKAIERGVELAALSLVLSVSTTVLAGFALLNGPGFSASWTNPLLEAVLAAVTAVALAAAWVRGAFAKVPPAGRPLEPAPGAEGGWELLSALEGLAREERHLRRALRRVPADGAEARRIRGELETVARQRSRLERAREAEYASE
jgi:hypothetical protein